MSAKDMQAEVKGPNDNLCDSCIKREIERFCTRCTGFSEYAGQHWLLNTLAIDEEKEKEKRREGERENLAHVSQPLIRSEQSLSEIKYPCKEKSDGSTASYYKLPEGAKELQDLISHKDMNAQIGEIFRACYRYGEVEHSPRERDLKKIIFYATAELDRLSKLTKE